MITYIDTKSGKVDITKAELEKLLREKYNEGYKDGTEFCRTPIYFCPYGYNGCPYWPHRSITWTSANASTEGSITGEDFTTSNITVGLDSTHTNSTTDTITFKEK